MRLLKCAGSYGVFDLFYSSIFPLSALIRIFPNQTAKKNFYPVDSCQRCSIFYSVVVVIAAAAAVSCCLAPIRHFSFS